MPSILPAGSVAVVVSCHVEYPLDDRIWRRFAELQRHPPGGFPILALMRAPHDGEDRVRWLQRAREAAARAPFGHHTHWTSPTHARPVGDVDTAAQVREEAAWLREQGLAPTHFCGGGWYTDERVEQAVAELQYVDCTPRGGEPSDGRLPTTHTLGALARASVAPRLPRYVHAYFHDYDLVNARRRLALATALRLLRVRGARPLPL
jgi:hypothetical protein